MLIDRAEEKLSVRRQCELLGVGRSGLYYCAAGENAEKVALMRKLDEQYTRTPYYGVRRMTAWLQREGWEVNPKRVRRLLRVMGLEAIYPKHKLSQPEEGRRVYPYLLRDVAIERVDHVRSSDITYIRMARSWLYLVAVIDWSSRYVLSWRLAAEHAVLRADKVIR